MSVNFVACSSDDNDENENNSPLVGTWVNIENKNSMEYKEVMTINENGTGSSAIYTNGQLDKDGVDNFRYTYDENSKVFTWIWEEDSDGESDVYSMHVRELTGSKLVLVDDMDEEGDSMKLTSIQSITDFMNCAGRTLPDNIRLWARRNLAVARSSEVSQEERHHAQRALSIMMNIQWKNNYFEAIDPDEARRILDEELYGMERVKQRIMETIIQINRTHTLPAYGLLLVGPAGTGKSQIAYAVARILRLPWTTLDMSSINDPEQLTGSSRIYSNAKPGIIMDAFSMAGESNLVFIINELDKASSGKGNGNPADVLLTLLDNLGFTDNYMECMIPTVGVYPIATANEKDQISAPLMSRFAVIDIPDYTSEEKKIIFSKFALPKVLKRMSLKENECIMTDEALDEVIEIYKNTSGIRDLEQAAEHIAANALYQIEVNDVDSVEFNAKMIRELLV